VLNLIRPPILIPSLKRWKPRIKRSRWKLLPISHCLRIQRPLSVVVDIGHPEMSVDIQVVEERRELMLGV
ncbi:hypothetical protein A2U01_0100599, partial [Trifolium medium]|nr:hypothetical protein [Trifolium medium]